MTNELVIDNVNASVGEKEILRGVNLTIRSGEVHVIMGPNGCGKSTLAHVITGRPGYVVTGGSVRLNGEELLSREPFERVRAGVFLAMQHPLEVPGVRPSDMLRAAGASGNIEEQLSEQAERVGLRPELMERFVNVDQIGRAHV